MAHNKQSRPGFIQGSGELGNSFSADWLFVQTIGMQCQLLGHAWASMGS